MLHSKGIHRFVIVDARVAFAAVETSCKGRAELPDQIVIGNAQVAELEREPDEMSEEVWSVDAAINKDGAVDVRV